MIISQRSGNCVTLTLNRPEKANALTLKMLERLLAEVESLGDAKALILTGRGRVFSAGADLEAVHAGLATAPVWEAVSGAIARFAGFSICALNGSLAGGAFGMALACDMRVTVPTAQFFYPVMRLGFLPQPSDPARLTALVGPARAKMVLMGGAKWNADQALRFGLVDAVGEDAVALAHVQCDDVLAADAAHVAAIKRLI